VDRRTKGDFRSFYGLFKRLCSISLRLPLGAETGIGALLRGNGGSERPDLLF
jgi:hypothetical protein